MFIFFILFFELVYLVMWLKPGASQPFASLNRIVEQLLKSWALHPRGQPLRLLLPDLSYSGLASFDKKENTQAEQPDSQASFHFLI